MSKLTICMVSDFFHPGIGGIEMHIYNVGIELRKLGHKVIGLTHYRGDRHGVRYLAGGMKVYYLPFATVYDVVTLPTCISLLPLARKIFTRERVDIVHGHQATSNLALEAMFHARTLGLHVVYTDHSLFTFEARGEIHVNKLLKTYLSDTDHCISVSHTDRENLVLRAGLTPKDVFVIPNAFDVKQFYPVPERRPPPPRLVIVVIARLTYRKGVDLLAAVIPIVCRLLPNAYFVIGGDGPKRLILEEMRENYQLEDRVEMLEAAACGLLVVATRVGGVPEVLPPEMRILADPEPQKLVDAIVQAAGKVRDVDPFAFHRKVGKMYNWTDIAIRTERVYRSAMAKPQVPMLARLSRIRSAANVSGIIFSFVGIVDYVLLAFLDWMWPRSEIEVVPDWYRVPTVSK